MIPSREPNAVLDIEPMPVLGRALFAMLNRLAVGTLVLVTPDERTHVFSASEAPRARLRIKRWSALTAMFRSAEIGLAESYRDGLIEIDDLTAFLELCVGNQRALDSVFYGSGLSTWLYRLAHALRANTRRGAKRNIHAHYDLGNAFYALWLDPTMTYSAALFSPAASESLEQAQYAKYERVLDMLEVHEGETILEMGCGWGGFAEYAARTRGARVMGITLSKAQLDYARSRIARAGLGSHVDVQFIDYRDVRGQYDHVVSIEMFEAVGERYWPACFAAVRARLKPGRRALMQTITIDESAFARYRAGSDFIREFIFPGGMLPSPTAFRTAADRAGLTTRAPFFFGRDYARTLAAWRERVDATAEQIKAQGFDDAFLRIWRFYLAYCEAGFRTGRTSVMQIELTHA